MGVGRLGAGLVASGLQHDDRLGAGRATGGRHELLGVRHLLDIEEDGAAFRIAGEIVQRVAEVDVGHLAHRHDLREADPAALRPVDDGRHQRTGLGEEGEVPLGGHAVGEARIDAEVGQNEADAVGAENAQAGRTRRLQHALAQIGVEAGSDDDGGARAVACEIRNHPRDRVGRRGDDREIRSVRKGHHGWMTRDAVDRGVTRIDQLNVARKAAGPQVRSDDASDAASLLARPDESDGGRREHELKVSNGHPGILRAIGPWLRNSALAPSRPCRPSFFQVCRVPLRRGACGGARL